MKLILSIWLPISHRMGYFRAKNEIFAIYMHTNQLYYLYFQNSIPWFLPLKIGSHDYNGTTIDTVPIRTTSGLCYKVTPLKFQYGTALLFMVFMIGNSENKVNMYVATNNTWQGLIYGDWPTNTKNPVKIVGEKSPKSINQYLASLDISEWSYMEGNTNYSECLRDNEVTGIGCYSMFHPNSYKFENRYV